MSNLKNFKTLKEKSNVLKWSYLRATALDIKDLQIDRFYIFVGIISPEEISPMIRAFWEKDLSFPVEGPEIVDVKILRILLENEESLLHISDGTNVIIKKVDTYGKDWVICDISLEVTRTSSTISDLCKNLNTLDVIDTLKKLMPQQPQVTFPSLVPNLPHTGPGWPTAPTGPGWPTAPTGPGLPYSPKTNIPVPLPWTITTTSGTDWNWIKVE